MNLCLHAPQLSALGFRHGFSLRTGGASQGPFASLNLGRVLGDELQAVEENHRRLAAEVGYEQDRLFEVSQVHGAGVRAVGPRVPVEEFRALSADAVVASLADDAVAIRTADCLPLLLADPDSGAVAAVHGGWRGVVAGVVPQTVKALTSVAGAAPSRLYAAVFPHIRPCCFEIGEEVAEQLAGIDPAAVLHGEAFPRPHGNLSVAVQRQLRDLGLPAAHIEDVPGCTMCDADRFFSFRRDGQTSGRHLAVIVAGCVQTP